MAAKAGIITFHCVPNYGAALQAYGLQEYLSRYCDSVELIDYRPEALTKEYNYMNFYSVFSVAASLLSLPSYYRKVKKFERFMHERLKLSSQSGTTASAFERAEADMVFLGSDQIWNAQILGGIDPVYFGMLPWKQQPYRVSYAASIGKSALSEEERSAFERYLPLLDRISVRETEAKDLISPLTESDVSVVVDPTILAGRECFEPFVQKNRNGRYLLLYSLTGNPKTVEMAQKVAAHLQMPIIEITGKRKGLKGTGRHTLYTAGPEEFVSLIANAAFVVTDSFHGTAFSLLFHRSFVSIPHSTRGGRLRTLLELCERTDRLTDVFTPELADAAIDWDSVDALLAAARESSHQFVQESINRAAAKQP